MPRKLDYAVAAAGDPTRFLHECAKLLEMGWSPQGGIALCPSTIQPGSYQWAQGFTKAIVEVKLIKDT